MNKLISGLLALLLSASISSGATTASSPSSVLSQLGVSGVTDKIYGTNATLYANYLIKTGTNGLMDVSLLPTSVNPVAWNKMFFVDPVHGTDSSNTIGSVTTPFKTIAYASARSTDNTVLLLEPGTYPNSTITNTAVTNLTIIGQSPETTWVNGFIRFDNGVNATLNLYRVKVDEINQNQYKTITIGLYDRAYLNGAVTRIDTNVTSAITVYRDPSVVLAVGLPSITTTEVLTHNATNMAYTVISTNIWWPSLYGPVPITIGQCLENLAGRPVIVQGTAQGQVPYWDGTKWALIGTGTVSRVLHGGTNPVFSAMDATDVVYTASTPTNWSLFIGSVPATVLEALNGVAAYAVPRGTNAGQVAYWSGSRWDLIPAGTATQVLIGGTAPSFINFYPMPAGTTSGQVAYWNGLSWTLVDAGTTNTSLRGGTTPSFVTNSIIPYGTAAGQIAYWNGTSWAFVTVGGTNQILYGGAHPAFGNFSLTFGTNNIPFDFVPYTNGVYSIGTPSLQWLNGYFSNAVYIDGHAALTNFTEVDPVFTNWLAGITNAYGWSISTNVNPASSNVFDLGSLAFPWRDLYLGSNSIYMGGTKVLSYSNSMLVVNVGMSNATGNVYAPTGTFDVVKMGGHTVLTNEVDPGFNSWRDGSDIRAGYLSSIVGSYGSSVVIGNHAKIGSEANIAIGPFAEIGNDTCYGAIALGYLAVVPSNMGDAVEIGTGTASSNGWFHFKGVPIIDPIGNYYGPTGTFSAVRGTDSLSIGSGVNNVEAGSVGSAQYGSVNLPQPSTAVIFNSAIGSEQHLDCNWGDNIINGASAAGQWLFVQGQSSNVIFQGSHGAAQHGSIQGGLMVISNVNPAASQWLYLISGRAIINSYAYGSSQHGYINGSAWQSGSGMVIGDGLSHADGASQWGRIIGNSGATNRAVGALQLFDLTSGQSALTTTGGVGSILLGAGIASNKYAIVAGDNQVSHGDGSVSVSGGFWNNGVRVLTNYTETDPVFVAWTNGVATALGKGASATNHGVAIGETPYGYSYGTAVGGFSSGHTYGVGIGNSAQGYSYGVAVGYQAVGNAAGNVALGYQANANPAGVYFDTAEIGTGTATNNGWFHYRGKAVIDPIGNVYAPTGSFDVVMIGSNGFWSAANGIYSGTNGWVCNTNFNPASSNAFDLGSTNSPWRDIYLGGSSIYMAGTKTMRFSNNQIISLVPVVYQPDTNNPPVTYLASNAVGTSAFANTGTNDNNVTLWQAVTNWVATHSTGGEPLFTAWTNSGTGVFTSITLGGVAKTTWPTGGGGTVITNIAYNGSNVITYADSGTVFRVSLTNNIYLNNPSNAIDGVAITWWLKQPAAGNKTIALGRQFKIPSSATLPLAWSTSGNAVDMLAARYDAATTNWYVISMVPGY